MKQYETSSSIRAPRFDPLANDRYSSVSKELSWATDNRLLEMRSWLYQPFLYWVVHCGWPRDSSSSNNNNYHENSGTTRTGPTRGGFPHDILNDNSQSQPQQPATAAAGKGITYSTTTFSPEDTRTLQTMITLGIETNLKILEVRSLRHRHHGLWYDLRSIMTASLLLLALVRSGNGGLIPGGLEELVGPTMTTATSSSSSSNNGMEMGGRMKKVLKAFEFWEAEAPDLKRAGQVLREVVRETVEMVGGGRERE